MIKVNGEWEDKAGMSLLAYLESEGCNVNRIAVEHNGKIVPKQQYESLIMKDGDELEVVSFVGGG